MDIVAVLLGWPSLLGALAVSALGIATRRPLLVAAAVILTLPMALYLAAAPRWPLSGLIAPAALGVSAWYCAREPRWPAVTGVVVYAGFLLWLLYVVTVVDASQKSLVDEAVSGATVSDRCRNDGRARDWQT